MVHSVISLAAVSIICDPRSVEFNVRDIDKR